MSENWRSSAESRSENELPTRVIALAIETNKVLIFFFLLLFPLMFWFVGGLFSDPSYNNQEGASGFLGVLFISFALAGLQFGLLKATRRYGRKVGYPNIFVSFPLLGYLLYSIFLNP